MQRRHSEDPFAGQLEGSDLQYHRQCFDHEYTAHHQKHNFLSNNYSDRAKCCAESKRTDIAHEYLGGIRVEPEKSESGSRQGGAEHGELARAGNIRKPEIARKDSVTRDVCEHSQGTTYHHCRHDRQAIEPVGQIDSIARSNNDEIGQHDEPEQAEGIRNLFKEWNDEFRLRR